MNRSLARAGALIGVLALAGCVGQPRADRPALVLASAPESQEGAKTEPKSEPTPAAPTKLEQVAEFDVKGSGRLSFTSDGSELRVGFRLAFDMRPGANRGKELRGTPKIDSPYNPTYRALSPDGKLLAGDCHIFNAAGTELLELTRAEKSRLNAVAFSPDGTLLAGGNIRYHDSRAADGYVYIWDTATGGQKTKLDLKYPVEFVAFAPNGKTLIVAAGTRDHGEVRRWEVGTWKELVPNAPKADAAGPDLLNLSGNPKGLALAPEGERLAVVTADQELIVADGSGVTRAAKGASDHLTIAPFVLFSPDGTRLVTHDASAISVWNPADLSVPPVKFEHGSWQPNALAFSPNGKVLAASGDIFPGESSVRLFDLTTGKERTDLPAFNPKNAAVGVAFHPTTGELVISSTRKLTVWAVPGGK
jgi:WD40 repeat protein